MVNLEELKKVSKKDVIVCDTCHPEVNREKITLRLLPAPVQVLPEIIEEAGSTADGRRIVLVDDKGMARYVILNPKSASAQLFRSRDAHLGAVSEDC